MTVKAGNTYKYQLQIRLANPNFQEKDKVAYPSLATEPELLSKFVDVTGALTVRTASASTLSMKRNWRSRTRILPRKIASTSPRAGTSPTTRM